MFSPAAAASLHVTVSTDICVDFIDIRNKNHIKAVSNLMIEHRITLCSLVLSRNVECLDRSMLKNVAFLMLLLDRCCNMLKHYVYSSGYLLEYFL